MGIDYTKESIVGSDPGGRIVKEDIIAFFQKRKFQKRQLPPHKLRILLLLLVHQKSNYTEKEMFGKVVNIKEVIN
jgi:hypothetical protein